MHNELGLLPPRLFSFFLARAFLLFPARLSRTGSFGAHHSLPPARNKSPMRAPRERILSDPFPRETPSCIALGSRLARFFNTDYRARGVCSLANARNARKRTRDRIASLASEKRWSTSESSFRKACRRASTERSLLDRREILKVSRETAIEVQECKFYGGEIGRNPPLPPLL